MNDLQTLQAYLIDSTDSDDIFPIILAMGFSDDDINRFGIKEIVEHAIFDIINPK